MRKTIEIVDVTIYRLDIYRLLALLLADEKIVKDEAFKDIGNDNFDNEVNRLLVLIAVVTRQFLRDNPEFCTEECGYFYRNYDEVKSAKNLTPAKNLTLKKACSMIIHAKDIDIKPTDYYYREGNGQKAGKIEHRYYKDIITVTGENKALIELKFEEFAKYCIQLSNKIGENSMASN